MENPFKNIIKPLAVVGSLMAAEPAIATNTAEVQIAGVVYDQVMKDSTTTPKVVMQQLANGEKVTDESLKKLEVAIRSNPTTAYIFLNKIASTIKVSSARKFIPEESCPSCVQAALAHIKTNARVARTFLYVISTGKLRQHVAYVDDAMDHLQDSKMIRRPFILALASGNMGEYGAKYADRVLTRLNDDTYGAQAFMRMYLQGKIDVYAKAEYIESALTLVKTDPYIALLFIKALTFGKLGEYKDVYIKDALSFVKSDDKVATALVDALMHGKLTEYKDVYADDVMRLATTSQILYDKLQSAVNQGYFLTYVDTFLNYEHEATVKSLKEESWMASIFVQGLIDGAPTDAHTNEYLRIALKHKDVAEVFIKEFNAGKLQQYKDFLPLAQEPVNGK